MALFIARKTLDFKLYSKFPPWEVSTRDEKACNLRDKRRGALHFIFKLPLVDISIAELINCDPTLRMQCIVFNYVIQERQNCTARPFSLATCMVITGNEWLSIE